MEEGQVVGCRADIKDVAVGHLRTYQIKRQVHLERVNLLRLWNSEVFLNAELDSIS